MSEQSIINLSCPICKLVFKNADTIYSTICGHIFHFSCLNSWRTQSTSCPQCRSYNPTTYRLYLNFDEVNKNTESFDLVEYKKKITDLEGDIETKIIHFQTLRSDFEKFRKSSESRCKELQELLNQQKMENQKLKSLLNDAKKMFEKKHEQAEQLLKENLDLKSDLESRVEGANETILMSKNTILEQRLKLVTTQLEKEIEENAAFSINRLALMQTQVRSKKPKQKPKANKRQPTTNKIIAIRNVPLDKVEYPLENVVITLGQKMNIELNKEKIKVVHKEMHPIEDKVTIWVELLDETSILHFRMCKNLLKNSDDMKSVEIEESDTNHFRPLFNYANTKLRGKVFKYIAIKPNGVVAKKNLYDKDEIIIASCSHVDSLLLSAQN